ncbi:MAG: hypothetical protein MMC33_010871 [Icmadophila ericetorum]|nr:hypothetical protein [Icmadophila ericetorum]
MTDASNSCEAPRAAAWACYLQGYAEALQLLLDAGALITDVDNTNRTALALAAGGGYADCVRALLAAGAKITKEIPGNEACSETRGRTPLLLAAARGHLEVRKQAHLPLALTAHHGVWPPPLLLKVLLAADACVQAIDTDGCTALHLAAQKSGFDISTPDAGALNHDKQTAGLCRCCLSYDIMMCVQDGHERIVRKLLKQGALPDALNRQGRTAAELAEANGHLRVIATLEASRAQPYEQHQCTKVHLEQVPRTGVDFVQEPVVPESLWKLINALLQSREKAPAETDVQLAAEQACAEARAYPQLSQRLQPLLAQYGLVNGTLQSS